MRTSRNGSEWTMPGLEDTLAREGRPGAGPPGVIRDIADPEGDDILLDVVETAAFLRVSPETVKYLRSQRRFAPAIKIGRRVLWLRTDLVAWRNQQREIA